MRMDTTARIVSLKLKHAGIEKEINEALQCPAIRVDGMLLQTLKREKLAIKDEIETLRRRDVLSAAV